MHISATLLLDLHHLLFFFSQPSTATVYTATAMANFNQSLTVSGDVRVMYFIRKCAEHCPLQRNMPFRPAVICLCMGRAWADIRQNVQ